MQEELVLKRRKNRVFAEGRTKVHIGEYQYNKVAEVAEETGKSIKNIVDIMVEYAYKHVKYEEGEE